MDFGLYYGLNPVDHERPAQQEETGEMPFLRAQNFAAHA